MLQMYAVCGSDDQCPQYLPLTSKDGAITSLNYAHT